jgi:hypothetical protein
MQRLVPILALLLIVPAGHAESAGRPIQDIRLIIPVSSAERNQVLAEMREFLHGLYNTQLALARKDMKGLAVIAKDMAPMLERMPSSLKERFPEEFSQMAIAQSEAFQSLARIGENNGQVDAALEQTAEILTYCSGCHDTYRFEVRAPVRTRR